MTREQQLETVLRDLLATIELHTDCMDDRVDCDALQPYIEKAEALLAEGWEPEPEPDVGGVLAGWDRTTSGAIGQP